MIVTPDMPREEGTTVAESGALLDEADVIGLDNSGVKVSVRRLALHDGKHVRLDTDSFMVPHTHVYLEPADAEALGKLLIDAAMRALENG